MCAWLYCHVTLSAGPSRVRTSLATLAPVGLQDTSMQDMWQQRECNFETLYVSRKKNCQQKECTMRHHHPARKSPVCLVTSMMLPHRSWCGPSEVSTRLVTLTPVEVHAGHRHAGHVLM
jgi:hypothetical protein